MLINPNEVLFCINWSMMMFDHRKKIKKSCKKEEKPPHVGGAMMMVVDCDEIGNVFVLTTYSLNSEQSQSTNFPVTPTTSTYIIFCTGITAVLEFKI
jgi:hypothetical protein